MRDDRGAGQGIRIGGNKKERIGEARRASYCKQQPRNILPKGPTVPKAHEEKQCLFFHGILACDTAAVKLHRFVLGYQRELVC